MMERRLGGEVSILAPVAGSFWLVQASTGASGSRVQRPQTSNARYLITWVLKQVPGIPQTLTRLRVDTQVLECPDIGNMRSLLNMLLSVDT